MARAVRWTPAAAEDLELVVQNIARDSEFYAAAFAREVRAGARSLSRLSERGRIVPELNDPTIREIFVRKYRLIYHVRVDVIAILAFVHGARLLRSSESSD